MEDLILQVNRVTGYKVSKSTISQLERGNADPKWNTLAVLAAAEFIKDKKGNFLTTNDLFAIACEEINPYINLISENNSSPSDGKASVSDLIKKLIGNDIDKPAMSYKSLPEMIQDAMRVYELTQEQLESKLQTMQSKNMTDVTLDRLRELQTGLGATPTREESRTLYMLLDTEGRAFPDYEWFGDMPTKNPTINELRENHHTEQS